MNFKEASEMRYNTQPVETFARPMEYTKKVFGPSEGIVIAQGCYEGLNYYVKNINGRHPTAYVEIPQGHKAYGMDFENYDEEPLIKVHWGVTFQELWLRAVDDDGERGHKFVGWDYGHAGDFAGYYICEMGYIERHSKRWTTEEIVEECKDAIDQINALEAK